MNLEKDVREMLSDVMKNGGQTIERVVSESK